MTSTWPPLRLSPLTSAPSEVRASEWQDHDDQFCGYVHAFKSQAFLSRERLWAMVVLQRAIVLPRAMRDAFRDLPSLEFLENALESRCKQESQYLNMGFSLCTLDDSRTLLLSSSPCDKHLGFEAAISGLRRLSMERRPTTMFEEALACLPDVTEAVLTCVCACLLVSACLVAEMIRGCHELVALDLSIVEVVAITIRHVLVAPE